MAKYNHILPFMCPYVRAKLEKVQKSQIQKSLELGLKKIKKFFEE